MPGASHHQPELLCYFNLKSTVSDFKQSNSCRGDSLLCLHEKTLMARSFQSFLQKGHVRSKLRLLVVAHKHR